MTVQHTPGPWETVSGPAKHDLAICEPGGGNIIAEVFVRTGPDSQPNVPDIEAFQRALLDRNLIAAAPELLAALEELAGLCSYMNLAGDGNEFCGDNYKEWIEERQPQARNAIAKATAK